MNYFHKILLIAAIGLLSGSEHLLAQQIESVDTTAVNNFSFAEDAPMLNTSTPKRYRLRDIHIQGVKYLNEGSIKSSAGLVTGDSIYLPSSFISNVINRLWGQRLFSDVKVGATLDGEDAELEIFLKERPRVYSWNFEGITKSKKKDLQEKLKLRRGTEYSDYVIDKNKKLIAAY
ncbi:MAG: outer membrane protein assembly factor BamA, partial [Alistipes sp.]